MALANGRELVLLFGMVLFAATPLTAQVTHPQVSGLDIGAKYSDIVRKLGRPISDRQGGKVPCGGAMRTLRYNGLVLRLETGDTDPLGLYKVEVTSAKWMVSRLRIGATRREVLSKLGPGPYFIDDGYLNFYYRKNKVIKIEWEFNFC
jgi:hypothetical protein